VNDIAHLVPRGPYEGFCKVGRAELRGWHCGMVGSIRLGDSPFDLAAHVFWPSRLTRARATCASRNVGLLRARQALEFFGSSSGFSLLGQKGLNKEPCSISRPAM